jgi:diguanylate cyclase (GGDEF)-like protein/PAS domain S-box-containing protein
MIGSTVSGALELLRGAGINPIVRSFPGGAIVVFDADLRYLCAGGEGLARVGLTQEMIEGKSIFEVFPPEISSVLEPPYRGALAGADAMLEIPFGDRVFIHQVAPLSDEHGLLVGGIGIAFEVTEQRRAEQSLRASEQSLRVERRRLREAESIGHSGSWEWDLVTGVITWSDGLFALHGLAPTTIDEGYTQAASNVHPDDRALVDAAIEACRSSDGTVEFRYRIIHSDGEIRWYDSRATRVLEDGRLVRLVGAVADVTDKVTAETEVIEANAFQHAILTASPDYTFIVDLTSGALVYGSRPVDPLGRERETMQTLGGEAIGMLVHPDDTSELMGMNRAARNLEDGEVLYLRFRARHADGQYRWLSRHVVPFRRDESGSVAEVVGVLRDITDVVKAEEQLSHDALHDSLTGLPNRALLLDRLEAALHRSVRDNGGVAILFCDLDGFKRVNDTAGHAAGDAVLIETAERLRRAVRNGDTVARVGGDEFVVIIEPWTRPDPTRRPARPEAPVDDRTVALAVADRIVTDLRAPIRTHGIDHRITVSVGIAYPSGMAGAAATASATEVVEAADAAMYRAKRRGKDRFEVFVPRPDAGAAIP